MKRISFTLLCCMAMVLIISSCRRNYCEDTYKIYIPVYKTLSEVRASVRSGAPVALRQTGKLYTIGSYIFLNEVDKGIHIINNSNPASPQNIGFLNIPGNVDLAVKGNYLYADAFSDLVVFDISNIEQPATVRFIQDAFPHRRIYTPGQSTNPDSIQIIVSYNTKDTTVRCDTYRSWGRGRMDVLSSGGGVGFATSAPSAGQGGSMARFTIVNDYLYTVSNSTLESFSISDPSQPAKQHTTALMNGSIETIYPFDNKLFIGSATGMFIYSLSNPAIPSYTAQFGHVRSCDPVIADAGNAYVTLRSGTNCGGNVNQLHVLNIANISNPVLVRSMALMNPHGLGKDGNLMMVCDGTAGLRIYNTVEPSNPQLLRTIPGFQTYDVIMRQGIALVVAKDGLYQFDYSDANNIRQVSKLPIAR